MKIGTNLVLLGILSLLVGTAFASPLLISELDIRPYSKPLPKGPTADIDVNVVYANFSVGETSVSAIYNRNVTEISYFVVLNITNNSDERAGILMTDFSAAESITRGISSDSIFSGENWTSSLCWDAEGAWVDGKWYNLTWVPAGWSDPTGEGYWMEGVQLKDKAVGGAVGGNVTNIYMNMNGTWVDVTGRVEWLDDNGNVISIHPERLPSHASEAVTGSGICFGEMLIFGMNQTGSTYDPNMDPGVSVTRYVTMEFNNVWEPHQSRLIAVSSDREVLSMFVDSFKIEHLKTEPTSFRGVVHSYLKDTVGVYDSTAVDDEIKQVQFETTDDGYIYNTILSDDEMFVMDSFGVEVFIEPRN
ncbi:MAG: hypothetical protein PVH73_03285 [Candidatus Bathyarchaeota archaeon]|jgi:hypothetical protein